MFHDLILSIPKLLQEILKNIDRGSDIKQLLTVSKSFNTVIITIFPNYKTHLQTISLL